MYIWHILIHFITVLFCGSIKIHSAQFTTKYLPPTIRLVENSPFIIYLFKNTYNIIGNLIQTHNSDLITAGLLCQKITLYCTVYFIYKRSQYPNYLKSLTIYLRYQTLFLPYMDKKILFFILRTERIALRTKNQPILSA